MAIQAAPETKTEDAKTHYGVVWLDARTQVDKDRRVVTLEDVKVTRADFPSDSDRRP